jgi:hypothetical protein
MKHFASQDWADFVRRVAPPERKIAMERHLDEGCRKCSKNLETWRKVVEFGAKEAGYGPPEASLRTVKGYFGVYKPRKLKLARLIFDSFRMPAAGFRSATAAPQQVVYHWGRYVVDMRLERVQGSTWVNLAGQILDKDDPSHGLDQLPVFLFDGQTPLGYTLTNRFGEFHLEFEQGELLRVSIAVDAQRTIEVCLPKAKEQTGSRS